jgi:hypothetical protein
MALQNCGLERREVSSDSENRLVNAFRGRFDDKRSTAIRANAQAVHKALESGFGCTCSHGHKSNIELNWHGSKSSPATVFTVVFSANSACEEQDGNISTSWKSISISIEDATQLTQNTTSRPQAASASSATSSLLLTATPPPSTEPPMLKKKQHVKFLGMHFTKDHKGLEVSNSSSGALSLGKILF